VLRVINEQDHHTPSVYVPPSGTRGRLIIDGIDVGKILVQGSKSSWSFGHFSPADCFSRYAPLFGLWSLLMHEDEHAPLHQTTSAELAEAERQMDALHVEVRFDDENVRVPVGQLNIDGELVEWKIV
jgi:hypothetical protein